MKTACTIEISALSLYNLALIFSLIKVVSVINAPRKFSCVCWYRFIQDLPANHGVIVAVSPRFLSSPQLFGARYSVFSATGESIAELICFDSYHEDATGAGTTSVVRLLRIYCFYSGEGK